jgi:hypothetical protein
MARNGHADCIARCPFSGAKRKTFARLEFFRFGPKAEIAAADGAAAGYLAALVVNQICGVPLTPACSIVVFTSGDDAKALALSAVLKSCVTVASFALSTD